MKIKLNPTIAMSKLEMTKRIIKLENTMAAVSLLSKHLATVVAAICDHLDIKIGNINEEITLKNSTKQDAQATPDGPKE